MPAELILPVGFAHVMHSLTWLGDSQPMAVTYGVAVSGDPATVAPNTVASQCGQAFATNMLPRLSGIVKFTGTEVRLSQVASDPPAVGVSTTGAADGSNGESALLPSNSAFLVHKRSALGGKRGRGRLYFPGVAESQTDNLGNLTSLAQSSWNTSLGAWLGAIAAAADIAGMVLLHSTGISGVPDPTPVTSLTLDPVIATQRRRLRK